MLPNGAVGRAPGRRRDLPERRGRVAGRRPAVPRPPRPRTGKTRAALPQRQGRATSTSSRFADDAGRRASHLAPVADRSRRTSCCARSGGGADAAAGEADVASTRARRHAASRTRRPPCARSRSGSSSYKRKDGIDLSFTLYTPPDYKEGTRVPAILYAYPLDYASSKTAGQVSGSEQYFTRLRDYQLLLLSRIRDHRQRGIPDRRRPEEGVRHLPRSARRRRAGRGRQGGRARASSIATASASPATATAR